MWSLNSGGTNTIPVYTTTLSSKLKGYLMQTAISTPETHLAARARSEYTLRIETDIRCRKMQRNAAAQRKMHGAKHAKERQVRGEKA